MKMISEIEERRNEMEINLSKIIKNTKTGIASDFLIDHQTDSK